MIQNFLDGVGKIGDHSYKNILVMQKYKEKFTVFLNQTFSAGKRA